jgi:hypothetical protein
LALIVIRVGERPPTQALPGLTFDLGIVYATGVPKKTTGSFAKVLF